MSTAVTGDLVQTGDTCPEAVHQLFDGFFYLKHNPDIAPNCDLLSHYLEHGGREGRDPHPLFDSSFYLEQNPDVALSMLNPLIHFVRYGANEGRDPHPLFDTSFYLEQNPDVADSTLNPLIHFVEFGEREGRDPHPLFDTSYYLEQSANVIESVVSPLLHYLVVGGRDGRNPHPLFDSDFYRCIYEDVVKADINPLVHYLLYGAAEKRCPSPFFNTSFYVETYGSTCTDKENPLVHYLTTGAKQGFDPNFSFNTNLYLDRVPGAAKSRLNPLVHYVTVSRFEDRHAVNAGESTDFGCASYVSARVRLEALARRPFSHLFVLNLTARGGTERSACSYIRVIAEKIGIDKILVAVTDTSSMACVDWMPQDTRLVNLPELEPRLSVWDWAKLLSNLIVATQPQVVFGFNSYVFWTALAFYLKTNQGQSPPKMVAYLGGYEEFVHVNYLGFNQGLINHSAGCIDMFITDNHRLRRTMIEQYSHLPSINSRVVTCYKSLTEDLHQRLSADARLRRQRGIQNRILWASRLDQRKRMDILSRIANQMPAVQFEVFGCAFDCDIDVLRGNSNISIMGEYIDFSYIPKDDKAVFLYTSEGDSMPNVLLEAAASGLPIVAPDIGAISELISENNGWLIPKCDDVDMYVRTLKYVLAHPEIANERSQRAQALVNDRHKWSAFRDRVDKLGIFWKSNSETNL